MNRHFMHELWGARERFGSWGDPREERFFTRFGGHGHGGGGGRHGHFERFFAAGGRERMFEGGDLQLIILSLLAEKPSYGYELIKAIEDRMGGGYAPSPGVVYPTLTLLEERGLAQVASTEGNRKTYTVTDAGRAELGEHAGRLADLMDRFQEGKERFGHGRSPEIRRAFLELRQAVLRSGLRAQEGQKRLSEEQIQRMAEAIRQAARTIDGL